MQNMLFTMLLALAIVGGTVVLGLSGITAAAMELATEAVEVACEQSAGPPENLAGEIFFLAQIDKKYKCVEKCSDDRYNCEKANKGKNEPGTKQNWDESRKCQVKYLDCLEKCE
jgi:hypothetical protein